MPVIFLLSFPLFQESANSIRQGEVGLHAIVLFCEGTAKDLT